MNSELLHMTTASALCVSTDPVKLLSVAQHLPITQWDLTFLHVSLKPKFHATTSTLKNVSSYSQVTYKKPP